MYRAYLLVNDHPDVRIVRVFIRFPWMEESYMFRQVNKR